MSNARDQRFVPWLGEITGKPRRALETWAVALEMKFLGEMIDVTCMLEQGFVGLDMSTIDVGPAADRH